LIDPCSGKRRKERGAVFRFLDRPGRREQTKERASFHFYGICAHAEDKSRE
jgi:hypothetical protein